MSEYTHDNADHCQDRLTAAQLQIQRMRSIMRRAVIEEYAPIGRTLIMHSPIITAAYAHLPTLARSVKKQHIERFFHLHP